MIATHPRALWLLRHAQSEGNVAREKAETGGLDWIDLATRDADVPISGLGRRQAQAFGRWLAEQPTDRRPEAVICSPFLRTVQTAELVLEGAGGTLAREDVILDERLRDRELGVLDQFTSAGVARRFGPEAERRARLGKFYYRPPGGESWADVCLRLRTLLADLARIHSHERVLVVTHEVPILLTRYLLDGMSEKQVLELGHSVEYANCGLTSYEMSSDGGVELVEFNHTVPIEEQGAPRTEESDAPAGPR